MKLFKNLLMIALLSVLAACSSGGNNDNTAENNSEATAMESSDGDDFFEENLNEYDEISDDGSEVVEDVSDSAEDLGEDGGDDSFPSNEDQAMAMDNGGGSDGVYVVKKNETLMWIAFKLYGDYRKWRRLASMNSDKLGSSSNLREGMQLAYDNNSSEFSWNPKGEPYLIQWGDTLGKISIKVYQNQNKWRNIWENNRQMIKSPDLIFAGFTLYYVPMSDQMARL